MKKKVHPAGLGERNLADSFSLSVEPDEFPRVVAVDKEKAVDAFETRDEIQLARALTLFV
jgi:hypothetical protein